MNALITNIRKLTPILVIALLTLATIGCSSSDDNPVAPQTAPGLSNKVGQYTTHYRWGGASGLWRGQSTLQVTTDGRVLYGQTEIIKPTILDEELTWSMADGNKTNAWLRFEEKSDADFFWRDKGGVDRRNFMGWIQNPGEGRLDFRGLTDK